MLNRNSSRKDPQLVEQLNLVKIGGMMTMVLAIKEDDLKFDTLL